MIKYLVLPGEIKLQTDGEIRYISAGKLMYLYGVPISECIVIRKQADRKWKLRNINRDLIPLRPQFDGNYSLPEQEPDNE